MKKKIIAAVVSSVIVVTGGVTMAIKSNDRSVNDVASSQSIGAKEEVATPTVTVQEVTPEPAPQTTEAPQQSVAPRVDQACLAAKDAALAPLAASLADYDNKIAERTVFLTDEYNTHKGLGLIQEWVTLEFYINNDLDKTLRPVKAKIQDQYNTEAAKHNC